MLVQAAWAILTPLLSRIDAGEFKERLHIYKQGGRGPEASDELASKMGYTRNQGYIWIPPTLAS